MAVEKEPVEDTGEPDREEKSDKEMEKAFAGLSSRIIFLSKMNGSAGSGGSAKERPAVSSSISAGIWKRTQKFKES